METPHRAYLRVRRFSTQEIVHSVGLSSLSNRYVEGVMLGMLRNMNTEDFFIDDSEVDEARKKEACDGRDLSV